MLTLNIAIYEFKYVIRSITTGVLFSLLLGISFLLTANSGEFIGAARGGAVYVNSPYMITLTLIIIAVFSIFVIPSFMANSILKDVDHRFDGVLYATPITSNQLLAGRFLGSFIALITTFTAVPAGMILGCLSPFADPATLAPLKLSHYAVAFFGYFTPSMLALAAFIFSTAVLTRRLLYTYVIALCILILYLIVSETNLITPLWDPFMHRIVEEYTQFWTASERNAKMLNYDGIVLANRLIWLGLAAVFFVIAMSRFTFQVRSTKAKPQPTEGPSIIQKFRGKPTWDRTTSWSQFKSRVRFELSQSLLSFPFLIVMILCLALMVVSLLDREQLYGVNALPLTRLMVDGITGSNWWAMLAILGFFSADIISRERSDSSYAIIDALPVSNQIFATSKLIALLMIMSVTLILGIGIAVSFQIQHGGVAIEWSLYFKRIFFYFILPYLYLAILACFFQVMAPNRLIGMVLMGLFILFSIGANDLLGLQHPLSKYALGGFPAPYSDMNGSGRFSAPAIWIRVYWAAIAAWLLMMIFALWKRGELQPMKYRLRDLQTKGYAKATVLLILATISSGGYIYYQTNTVNDYVTQDQSKRLRANFEKNYRQYEDLPMPTVIAVETWVDLFPHQNRVQTRGIYQLKNKTTTQIEEVHILYPPGTATTRMELEGGHRTFFDKTYQYAIFQLDTPLQPNAVITLEFETVLEEKGFEATRPNISLVKNGTFLTNGKLTPFIGFNQDYLLEKPDDRREMGLDPLPRIPALEDVDSHNESVNRQDSDFISFKTTLSTSHDQIAIAPGDLEKEWQEGNRRYFSYRMTRPMMHFYSISSAQYEVVRDQWRDVTIEIYHHKPHTHNLDRMMEAAKDSLELFSKHFSPYQFNHLRILEFPAYRSFAQSFAGTIPYSESMGFVSDVRDHNLDMPYYITAHEVAHQWWGHQVTAANCQGASMLNETLAQYSALLVMEQKYGKDKIRQFLAQELELYLKGRADEPEGERPLYRVEGQDYIHYRKGALVMYALKDYLGAEVINRSLQRYISLRAWQSEPYATSADFLAILREEAGDTPLITDFFERITIYDLSANSATIQPLEQGGYEIDIDVKGKKLYADALGNETAHPLDIPVDIGLFLKHPDDPDFNTDDVIMLMKSKIDEPLKFQTDQKPIYFGIDPYHKLIDRVIEDNIRRIE